MRADPDLELWRRVQRQDQAAYDCLQRKYRPLVYGEIRRRFYHAREDDLQDVAQEVWVAVWTGLPRFRGDSSFSTWLVGIAKNAVFERLRRMHTGESASAEDLAERTTGDEESLASRCADHLFLQAAMQKLPDAEREPIHLRYWMQLTDEEISERLGLPLGTTKSRLGAGLKRLREIVQCGRGEET